VNAIPSQKTNMKARGLRATKRSLIRTLLWAFGRWSITCSIVLTFFAVLRFYSERVQIISFSTERELNVLITGLSIALGLSIAMGLSAIIANLRWWVLSLGYHSIRKVCSARTTCSERKLRLAYRSTLFYKRTASRLLSDLLLGHVAFHSGSLRVHG